MKNSVFGHLSKKSRKFKPSFGLLSENTIDNTPSRELEACKENQKVIQKGYEKLVNNALKSALAQHPASKRGLTESQRLSKIQREHSKSKTPWSPQLQTIQEVNNEMASLQQ